MLHCLSVSNSTSISIANCNRLCLPESENEISFITYVNMSLNVCICCKIEMANCFSRHASAVPDHHVIDHKSCGCHSTESEASESKDRRVGG